ncbi:hypothetical protein [Thiomicrorhabdus sp.]|uniref:hypothetical protein n=1 Tax=Thiomicrorhabdus sp. TaxID=2039724 RepID=UPI0029C806D4|nr:hypothetical protein [Thiomicrorhabdus sp.]
MKKTLLATAIATALIGLSACQNESSLSTDSSSAVAAKSASMTISANLPQPEASAAVINSDTNEVVVKLYHLEDFLNAVIANAGEDNNIKRLAESALEQLAAYSQLEAADLTVGKVATFAQMGEEIFNQLVDSSGSINLDNILTPVKRVLKAGESSTTIENLRTGTYLVHLAQNNADGDTSSVQHLFATLGEEDNAVVANMLNGTWTFVNANNQAQPVTLSLLNTNHADYVKDWDPVATGVQTFMEAFSEGNASNNAEIKQLHYLSLEANPIYPQIDHWVSGYDEITYEYYTYPVDADGNQLDTPIEAIFSIADQGETQNVNSFESNSDNWDKESGIYSSTQRFLGGSFSQAYDHRLPEGSRNVASPNPLELSYRVHGGGDEYQEQEMQELSGGFFVLTTLQSALLSPDEEMPDGSQQYQYKRDYIDAEGNSQSYYYINAYNYETVFTTPDGQQNIEDSAPSMVEGGTRITGTLVEYTSNYKDYSRGVISDDSDMKPTEAPQVAMALAMQKIAQQNGAYPAAAHPLGTNCTDIEQTYINRDATYAWIDNEWVSGVQNYSYKAEPNQDGYVISGLDYNGNGVVEPFEAGITYNEYYTDQSEDNSRLEIAVVMEVIDGSGYTNGDFIPASDIANSSLWTQNSEIPNQYSDNQGNVVQLYSRGEEEQMTTTFYAADHDGDGVAERYESAVGYQETKTSVITACIRTVYLKGEDLTLPRSDFAETVEVSQPPAAE